MKLVSLYGSNIGEKIWISLELLHVLLARLGAGNPQPHLLSYQRIKEW